MQDDRVVYKVVRLQADGRFTSPYQSFDWEEGQYYYQDDDKMVTGGIGKWYGWADSAGSWMFSVHEGLHACSAPSSAHVRGYNQYNSKNIRIIEMVIPKGAKYYEQDGDIVSTEMIFPEGAKAYTLAKFAKKFIYIDPKVLIACA